MIKQAENVLNFWFGPLKNKYDLPVGKEEMWFRNGKAYDEIVRAEFLTLHGKASDGQLKEWVNYPRSLLALIILLDQFSRHIYRNQARAFAQDTACLEYVMSGIANGLDKDLYFIERNFFYMPLMHAEDLAAQDLSIRKFTDLCEEVPKKLKEKFSTTLSFARSHRFVISQFGRFPELNDIMGRQSTPEETAFLETGKYRFL